jgi:transcription antitermination factor NusG
MTGARNEGRWVILLPDSQNTLALAASLNLAGIEAWAPVEIATKRVPRANVKRKITRAMLPGYVFVHARHLLDLLALANAPITVHGKIRFMRESERIPLVADSALSQLRTAERYRKPLERKLMPGEKVRLTEGAFAGCSGVVETARGKFAMVQIPGFRVPLKIAEWHLLRSDEGSGKRLAA